MKIKCQPIKLRKPIKLSQNNNKFLLKKKKSVVFVKKKSCNKIVWNVFNAIKQFIKNVQTNKISKLKPSIINNGNAFLA